MTAYPSVPLTIEVLVREDVPGYGRLVAYVAGPVEANEMRAHLRQSLSV